MAPADEVNIIHVLSWSEWKPVGQERQGEQGSYSLPLCRLPRAQADVGTPVLSPPRSILTTPLPLQQPPRSTRLSSRSRTATVESLHSRLPRTGMARSRLGYPPCESRRRTGGRRRSCVGRIGTVTRAYVAFFPFLSPFSVLRLSSHDERNLTPPVLPTYSSGSPTRNLARSISQRSNQIRTETM